MKTFRRFLLTASLLFALVAGHAFADQSVVRVDPALERIDLSSLTWVLEDPSGTLDFDTIGSAASSERFVLRSPALGLSKSVFWLRFTLHNSGDIARAYWFDTGVR